MKNNQLLVFILMALLVLSCKKGDDGPVITTEKEQEKTNPAGTVLTGVFKDAAVSGLSFSTTSQSGTTNDKGEFKYVDGEDITFKLGNVTVGKVKAEAVITPITIAKATDANATIETKQAQNIAALLQTLDTDGVEANGITISPETASNLGISQIDFTKPIEATLADIVVSVTKNTQQAIKVVYPSEAAANMATSLGLTYTPPSNYGISHLLPTLKSMFHSTDFGSLPASAVYKNTFNEQGLLVGTDVLSRYSGKIFKSIVYKNHAADGLPSNGEIRTFNANRLGGGNPSYPEYFDGVLFSYTSDKNVDKLVFINGDGSAITETVYFTGYNADNQPLSFYRELYAEIDNKDLTITWDFTYTNGLISAATRTYDGKFVYTNYTDKAYTTRDFTYTYNAVNNVNEVNYNHTIVSNVDENGVQTTSRSESTITETYAYDNKNKLVTYEINTIVTPDTGDAYTSKTIKRYDENEQITEEQYTSSNGYEGSAFYSQGLTTYSKNTHNGLITSENTYNSDGSRLYTSFTYDAAGQLLQKNIYKSGTYTLEQYTIEYYDAGELTYYNVEDYTNGALEKSTWYFGDGTIDFISYYDAYRKVVRVDIYYEGALNYYIEKEYDANGIVIRDYSKWPDGELYGIREFTYNSNGYTDTITYKSADESVYAINVYEYDDNNYLSKLYGYTGNNTLSFIAYYEEGRLVREEIYDENGTITEEIDYTQSGKKTVLKNKTAPNKYLNRPLFIPNEIRRKTAIKNPLGEIENQFPEQLNEIQR